MEAKTAKNLLFSGLLLTLSVSSVVGTVNVLKRGERLIEAKKQLEELKRQKADLEREAEYRKSPEFVEQEARNKLNMAKPGEEIYLKPKILGDDLLGGEDSQESIAFDGKNGNFTGRNNAGFLGGNSGGGVMNSPGSGAHKANLFTRLFDKIRELLLLFQS